MVAQLAITFKHIYYTQQHNVQADVIDETEMFFRIPMCSSNVLNETVEIYLTKFSIRRKWLDFKFLEV
jgi:hypothetical protein